MTIIRQMHQKGIAQIHFIVLLIIVIVIVGGVGFWWWRGSTTTSTLGSQIYKGVQNPIKGEIPETYSFTIKANPFKNIYPNPFDRISK